MKDFLCANCLRLYVIIWKLNTTGGINHCRSKSQPLREVFKVSYEVEACKTAESWGLWKWG